MAPHLYQTLVQCMRGYRLSPIRESRRLTQLLRESAKDLDMHVVFLKHERLAAFLQNCAAARLQRHMLMNAETLPEVHVARDANLLAHGAWEVTVAQLEAEAATNASFVTISSTEDSQTENSMKRKREAEAADAEAKRLGFNSDEFGSNGFPRPHEFADESVNAPAGDNGDDDDDAPGDLPSPPLCLLCRLLRLPWLQPFLPSGTWSPLYRGETW